MILMKKGILLILWLFCLITDWLRDSILWRYSRIQLVKHRRLCFYLYSMSFLLFWSPHCESERPPHWTGFLHGARLTAFSPHVHQHPICARSNINTVLLTDSAQLIFLVLQPFIFLAIKLLILIFSLSHCLMLSVKLVWAHSPRTKALFLV